MKKPAFRDSRLQGYQRPLLIIAEFGSETGFAVSSMELDQIVVEEFTWA